MLRRRLVLYTLLYIAGITAGFFVFEKSRIPESMGFIAATAAFVCLARPQETGRYESSEPGLLRPDSREVMVLIIFFLSGFILFSIRFFLFGTSLDHAKDTDAVRGKVVSVAVKKNKLNLVVKNSDKGPGKILIILDEAAVRRSEECGEGDLHFVLRKAEYIFIGSDIEAKGSFEDLASADDPGCFDYSIYMKGKGICAQFRAYTAHISGQKISAAGMLKRNLFRAREEFLQRFDEDTESFIRGVIFGDKSEIDDSVIDEFNRNSTGHILAVSGLHIGFLYGLLKVLTGRKRTPAISLLITAVILVYGEMTMWSPATIRACVVMTVNLMSVHLRRRSDLLTSVGFAALIILTIDPYQLFNSGFQLSFMALCGIAFFTGPVSKITGEALGVMLAVQLGTLPVAAYWFCRINPLSVLINVPIIILASVLVPLCILLLMIETLFGIVPSAGISFAELISFAVLKMNHLMSFNGAFSIKTAGPGAAVIIGVYLFAFGASSEWVRVMILRKEAKTVLKQAVLLLMPVIMLSACFYDRLCDDEIVFVAVGQGDCTHIRTEGHDVLIDGGGQAGTGSEQDGNDDNSGFNVGKNILMPYLLHEGADKLDIAFVTHLHSDHYKGIAELSELYPVGAVGIPADYRGALEESDKASRTFSTDKIIYVEPDTRLVLQDDVSISVIWPEELSGEPLAADDPNEHNTVYMINYKGIKAMITGDLLEEDEHEMVEYYRGTDILKCDILKVAHHGSKSSSSEEFLDEASPEIAVIECGRNNFYGHPHRQTLDRLEKRGIKVFRTDISGAVGIDIRKGRLLVDLFKPCVL